MSEKYCKYGKMQRWVSYDSGVTWSPLQEFRTGDLIEEYSEDCGYVPTPTPSYSGQYLTFRAREDNFYLTWKPSTSTNIISYSLDSGTTWQTLNSGNTTAVNSGETIMVKGELTPVNSYPSYGVGYFQPSKLCDVEGNVMSLLYGDNFEGETDLTGKDYAFKYLFSGMYVVGKIVSAENLVLPATTLSTECYYGMFYTSKDLVTAPSELPATTLADSCYRNMFSTCSGLTAAPAICATTMATYACTNMFYFCTSLTTAPELLATTLASNCYNSMFSNCSGLTTAPSVLPATTLAESCYQLMFNNCTSLTTAPTLSSTTLAPYCCQWMFQSCSSLTSVQLLSPTLSERCYGSMFMYCSSLNNVTCLATDISAPYCTSGWLDGVSSTGTFTKASGVSWPRGRSGIPQNWTVVNA